MAMSLDAFVGIFVKKMTDLVTEKAIMMLGVKEDLERLQERMERLQKFMEAAERRRLKDTNLELWVAELKDVAYEADDIIDLCRVRGARLLADHPPSPSSRSPVCFNCSIFSCFYSIPHRYKISKRIREVNDRLEEIYKDRIQFKLEESLIRSEQVVTTVNTIQTSSLPEFDVVGSEIKAATEELVKLIVQEQGNTCGVFAITGMGGIGKTTLAQKVFNDAKMQEFDSKIWVCISQKYSEIDVLHQVIKGAKGNHGEARTKAELEPLLASTLSGRRVFLVLDDIWNADLWLKLLRNPLQSADASIRILVTTRDENIARQMRAAHTHHVNLLSDETGWALLCRKVFGEENQEEIRNVQDIGLEIAKKCDGLPLAINAIAGVLTMYGSNSNRDEWEKVLKNEAWFMSDLSDEAFSGALYLSFDVLSSPLKQCFLYCSLFPEDETLERSNLVRLWVAEGFVEEKTDCLLEETAEGYYNELLRRNLLQIDPNVDDNSKCSMHDVMRSFAMFLSKDETLTPYKASSTKLRRLAIENLETLSNLPDLLDKHKCLRTLLVCRPSTHMFEEDDPGELRNLRRLFADSDQLAVLKRLRVFQIPLLNLNIKLSSSIGTVLINLRYLNVDFTDIYELPESIGSLTNLQFLSARGCLELGKVPTTIMQLHNLRCLDLDHTPISFIPKGIEKLGKLNALSGFVVANPGEQLEGSYSSLKDLGSLHHLRMLRIEYMERAQKRDVPSLANLTYLIELTLNYNHCGLSTLDYTGVAEALDELCPPKCLKLLSFHFYFGKRYPKWMQSPSFGVCFPSLTKLSLADNDQLTQLPPAGELPQLKTLEIGNMTCVRRIGPEFLGTGAFPKLEILRISDIHNLEEWSFGEIGETQALPNEVLLPRLVKLSITHCPNLKALPKGLERTAMKELYIANTAIRALSNLHNLTKLTLIVNNSLETIPHLPALRVLIVNYCKALKLVEKVDALQQLKFKDYFMEELPQWMVKLLQERKSGEMDDFHLVMKLTPKALRRCLKGGPEWSIVETIPSFIAKEIEKGFIRYSRIPFSYETNLMPFSSDTN